MYDEEYGGLGASALMTLVAIEEVSKVCATSGLILAVQELGSLGVKLAGTVEQKERYLPRLASGEWLAAYALTEPGSGSDSAAMRFEAGRIEPKMGIKGSTTGEIFFNDMRIPAENLLGEEGEGFKIAMRILDRSRPGIGAQGLGIAQGATDYALEYAKDRETMGKPIGQHQLIAGM